MKEQLYAPTGEEANEAKDKGNAPKKLQRPGIPQSLPNIKVPKGIVVGYRCACGAAKPKYGDCKVIPIYASEGWSGDDEYDGNGKSVHDFTPEEWETFHKGPVGS